MKIASLLSLLAIILFVSCGEKTTPNGFEFKKHTNSDGVKPNPTDYAFVHLYVMYDDSLVNSTRNQGQMMPIVVPDFENLKPEDLPPNGKPNPFQDMLAVMNEGDSATVYVPIDEQMRTQNPSLAGVQKLSYDIVVHEVKTEEEFKAEQEAERIKIQKERKQAQLAATGKEGEIAQMMVDMAEKYANGELKDKIKTTDSGLMYMMIEEGNGKQAEAGKKVDVHYYGVMTDGTMFDNSFSRGQPINFPLGQRAVIPGWDEGIDLMQVGDKTVLFIPSNLAYGSRGKGSIPPDTELIFYVELVGVN